MDNVMDIVMEVLVPVLGVLLASVFTLAANALRTYLNTQKAALQEAGVEQKVFDALLEGINVAHADFVREAKAMSADGKLTKEEIQRAQTLAINHAQAILTGPAKDVFLQWSREKLASVIRTLIKGLKS